MSHISQKPERIASALYLITSFFTDQEPAKWKLRTLAADLVSVGVSLISQMFKEREAARLEVRSIILEIRGLTTVAKNAGLISEPNFNVIAEELNKYLETLGFPAGLREENGAPVLSENFFSAPEKGLKAPSSFELGEGQEVKDKSSREDLAYTQPALKPQLERQLLPASGGPKEKPLREFGAVSVKKNSRQSVIIALLKRKKEIMIKDVSPLISGCSEKTIQRELLAMVQAGILRKTGEKRWSRYSLA
jgi:hypothetical protein